MYQHEAPDFKWLRMTRLQIEMILRLQSRQKRAGQIQPGIKRLILCDDSAGLRLKKLPAVVPIDGFCTLFAQRMPLAGNERCDPNSVLSQKMLDAATRVALKNSVQRLHVLRRGGHVFVHGPGLHSSKYDSALLTLSGASVIGNGLLPWAYLAALDDYRIPTLALTLVMNNMKFDFDHEESMIHAEMLKPLIRGYMSQLLSSLS